MKNRNEFEDDLNEYISQLPPKKRIKHYVDDDDEDEEYYRPSFFARFLKGIRIVCYVLIAIAIISIVSNIDFNSYSSNVDQTVGSNKTGKTQQVENSKPQSSKPIQKSEYEIVEIYGCTTINSIGSPYLQGVVVIENTGNTNLFLNDATFDVEDENGNLIASRGYINAYPQIIAPGERGVYFEEMNIDSLDTSKSYKLIPYLDVEKATVNLIRLNYSDVKIQEGSYGIYIDVLGRIHNTTKNDYSSALVAVICYDSNGKVIDVIYSYETCKAGEKRGFEISHHPTFDISVSDISRYDVYVYPHQFQW